MSPNDPKYGDCLFELRDLMRAKGDVRVISSIISQVIRIRKDAHCHGHKSNKSPSLGFDPPHDDVEHGYYDEDDDIDFDLDDAIRHLVLWQIFGDIWQEERNGFLIVDVPIT